MYPIAIAFLGAMLLSWMLATTEPQQIATRTQVAADAVAANFWAYRGALVSYQNANSAASGNISSLFLTMPIGYVPLTQAPNLPLCHSLAQWSNYIQAGKLYTFSIESAACLPAGAVDAIANRHDRSLMIGIATGTSPATAMTSVFNLSGSVLPVDKWTLPAAAKIQSGALVVIGN